MRKQFQELIPKELQDDVHADIIERNYVNDSMVKRIGKVGKSFGCPAIDYKIAKPLIKKIARKNKPILLSTGASNISEIWQTVEWIIEENNNQIVLLHCILSYPTKYKNANLGMIRNLNKIM